MCATSPASAIQVSWVTGVELSDKQLCVHFVEAIDSSSIAIDLKPGLLVIQVMDLPGAIALCGAHAGEARCARWSSKKHALTIAFGPIFSGNCFVRHVPNIQAGVQVRHVGLESNSSPTSTAVQHLRESIARLDDRRCQADKLYEDMQGKAVAVLESWDNAEPLGLKVEGQVCAAEQLDEELHGHNLHGITLLEDPAATLSTVSATGKRVWPAAVALIRVLSTQSNLLPRHGIPFQTVELGSGLGAVGLFVAKTWPDASVLLTDVDVALPLLKRNVAANFPDGIPKRVHVQALPLGTVGMLECDRVEQPDVILAADVSYRSELADMLVWTLHHLRASVNIVAVPNRPGSNEDFRIACDKHGFTCGRSWSFLAEELGRTDMPMADFDVDVHELHLI